MTEQEPERSGFVRRILRDGANPNIEGLSLGSHSAPVASHPNSRGSGATPLCSRDSSTKHTVRFRRHQEQWYGSHDEVT
jgi:hypothetical protein